MIVELVERPDVAPGPASFWGLVVIVDDIDAAGRVSSELYFEIFRGLRKAGIGAPAPAPEPEPTSEPTAPDGNSQAA